MSDNQGPELEALISYLVAAKRSLSSIHNVWHANEIVTAAQAAVEESVVTYARIGFLRRGLNNQLRLLYNVRSEVEDISFRGKSEFSNILGRLDTADSRLRKTLDVLRETIVYSAFRPAGEDPRSLHDFVDERGVEDLNASLKVSIDNTNVSLAELDASNRAFDDQLRSIKHALGQYRVATKSSSTSAASSSSSSASDSGMPCLSSTPSMLKSLEMHAQEMADLLQSLVRHFDLCVTAVKHTSGGGAAARSITGDMPLGVDINNNGGLNAQLDAPLEPMSQSEYQEMKNVVAKDAVEAGDVVMEIHERTGDMESILESILTQRASLISIDQATTDVFQHLSSLASTGLPGYIARAHSSVRVWNEERGHIDAGLGDLAELRLLYEGFLDAYDGLILEVTRRKQVRQRVEKVLRDTRQKLDQLYEEDVNARETFRVEKGDYLPSDIWLGVHGEPMRVEFLRRPGGGQPVGGASEAHADNNEQQQPSAAEGKRDIVTPEPSPADEGEVIPELPRHVIEQSLTRLSRRERRLA